MSSTGNDIQGMYLIRYGMCFFGAASSVERYMDYMVKCSHCVCTLDVEV